MGCLHHLGSGVSALAVWENQAKSCLWGLQGRIAWVAAGWGWANDWTGFSPGILLRRAWSTKTEENSKLH